MIIKFYDGRPPIKTQRVSLLTKADTRKYHALFTTDDPPRQSYDLPIDEIAWIIDEKTGS